MTAQFRQWYFTYDGDGHYKDYRITADIDNYIVQWEWGLINGSKQSKSKQFLSLEGMCIETDRLRFSRLKKGYTALPEVVTNIAPLHPLDNGNPFAEDVRDMIAIIRSDY